MRRELQSWRHLIQALMLTLTSETAVAGLLQCRKVISVTDNYGRTDQH